MNLSPMNRSIVIAVAVVTLIGASLLTWIDVRQQREFRRLVAVGDAALTHDRTSEAIEAFSGAIALKGDSMLPYLKRGDTYRHRGELEAALRDLRRAAALDPGAPRPAELLGDVNATLGRYPQAVEQYHRYLALDDRAPRVLYKLALAYYRDGRAAAAVEPLKRALGLDDRLAEAPYLLGLCLWTLGQPTEAAAALSHAVRLMPTLAAAREALAQLASANGHWREGLEQLEALAALEPSRAERLVNVGLAYARLGRRDAAVVTLGRAADRFPDSPVVYAALGRVWLAAAEEHHDKAALDRALAVLRTAALRPDASSDALTLYGRGLLLSGQTHAAEQVLQQAILRAPLDPVAFRYLSEAATRTGHVAASRVALARYTALTAAAG
jgi:tetratricopeptide (TPR) repeat protein